MRLGEILVAKGKITEKDVEGALKAQERIGGLFGETLVRMGSLSEDDLLDALSHQIGLPVADRDFLPPSNQLGDILKRLNLRPGWCLGRKIIPWLAEAGYRTDAQGNCSVIDEVAADTADEQEEKSFTEGKVLHIASTNPLDSSLQDMRTQYPGYLLRFYLLRSELMNEYASYYEGMIQTRSKFDEDASRLRELAQQAPIIDLVNGLFSFALANGASDVHVEPFVDTYVIRLRIDGVLRNWRVFSKASYDAVASRLKLLSGMDIAQRRLPQDGRQTIRVSGKEIDLRVSTLPTSWGESIVMRLLGKTERLPELEELGVALRHRETFQRLIEKPNGIFLMTGPTGSGKTTTIYRLLSFLNKGDKKIITVEDPVEFDLPGIMQVPVREQIGLSFSNGLRSILRQDPDVVMLGEIRDSETAKIALQAALTGHLVISTLHTNSAIGAVPRLLDLGLEPFLVADVLCGLAAQRLVRRLCGACARPCTSREAAENKAALAASGLHPEGGRKAAWKKAVGCAKCDESGYRGRLGIYEVLAMTESLRHVIRKQSTQDEILHQARLEGYLTMHQDGILKAQCGLTSLEEVKRVVDIHEIA